MISSLGLTALDTWLGVLGAWFFVVDEPMSGEAGSRMFEVIKGLGLLLLLNEAKPE